MTVLMMVLAAVVGVLVTLLVKDPLKRYLDRRREVRKGTKPAIAVRVYQIADPDGLGFDFAGSVTDQNSKQTSFLFSVQYPQIELSHEEAISLKNVVGKKEFVERLGKIVSQRRRETWSGEESDPYKGCFKGPRDLVITDIPLPGYFYGWNSRDRRLLVISTASVADYFPEGARLAIADFIERMMQRMVLFSTVTPLDPKNSHLSGSEGCLFDFTVELKRVPNFVGRPFICNPCKKTIVDCCGDAMSADLTEWVEKKSG